MVDSLPGSTAIQLERLIFPSSNENISLVIECNTRYALSAGRLWLLARRCSRRRGGFNNILEDFSNLQLGLDKIRRNQTGSKEVF